MLLKDEVEELEFTCPKCGSHHFGRSLGAVYCHGYPNGVPCRFSTDDDSKVFRGTGKFRPRTVTGRVP